MRKQVMWKSGHDIEISWFITIIHELKEEKKQADNKNKSGKSKEEETVKYKQRRTDGVIADK